MSAQAATPGEFRRPGIEPPPEAISQAGRRFLADAIQGDPYLQRRALELVHDIRIRDDIETARVRLHANRFLLEISPRFVATHLPTPADKRFVLMHEMRHLEIGDLFREGRFYRRLPRMVNFAMDIYANGSVLGSRYFAGHSPQVLDLCYDPRSRPSCLLHPPWRLLEAWSAEVPDALNYLETARYIVQYQYRNWSDDHSCPPSVLLRSLSTVVAEILSRAGFRHAHEAARLYLGGWSRTMAFNTFLERFHRLLLQEDLLEAVEGRPLLLEHDLEALADDLRRNGLTAGNYRIISDQAVTPDRHVRSDAQRVFFQALRAALISDPSHPTLRRDADVTIPSVLLHMGRREAALLAAGTFPVLFHAPGQALALSDERVHLYLDVSGSMDETLAFVTGLTMTVGELVGPNLYQFSNRVVSITWQQLEDGHIATTGGTDLDCVARHARRHGHRRILIVTDGHVQLSEESRQLLRRELETFVVLVDWQGEPSEYVTREIETFARGCWALPVP